MAEVDLTQLAINRSDRRQMVRNRRRVLARYVLPATLLASFLALLAWFARDFIFPPRSVSVVPVLATRAALHDADAPLFQAAGWIEPRPTMVRVAALAPGVVESLLVVEDQAVEAGEPIAELVKADAELAHERALADRRLREAELEAAQATLTATITRLEQPVHLQAELGQAEAALAETETELADLPFELQRAQAQLIFAQKSFDGKAAAGGAISGRTLDAAKSQVDSASALVDELRRRNGSLERQQAALVLRRNALQKRLELLADEIQARDEAKARVKAAQAQLEQADVQMAETRLRLERMTIRAPIDGRVFQLIAQPGTRLSSEARNDAAHDSGTVITMYRPDMLQVRVDVRFADIPSVSLSQRVIINNPALPEPLYGSVLLLSSEADIQKNTLEVKVAIPSPRPVLKPDMLVDVTFLSQPRPEQEDGFAERFRLFIPRQAVQREDDQSFVWVADQSDQVARKTRITTGLPGPDALVEITDGLTMSSRIILDQRGDLRDGQRIRVMGEAPLSTAVHTGSDDTATTPQHDQLSKRASN